MKNYNKFLLGFLIGLFVIFAILSPNRFLSVSNIQTMLSQMPEFGILALGMTIVILTAGINLSITAASALSGIMAAFFLTSYSGQINIYFLILGTIVVALITALVTGVLNGLFVAYVGVTPILVTIGTRTLFRGISLNFTRGGSISGFPMEFYWLGKGTIFQIPVPLLIYIAIIIFTYILLQRTSWGTKVYMIGSNDTAANFSGINVQKILMQVYIYSSVMAGIAAILMISRYNSAKVNLGTSYLLQSVAATVLGGTSIYGGRGSVFGTVIAVGILQLISSGFNILGINRFIVNIAMGGILILVLSVNYIIKNTDFSLFGLIADEKPRRTA